MSNPVSKIPSIELPYITQQITSNEGTPTLLFHRFLTGLWLRSGGADGVNSTQIQELIALAQTSAEAALNLAQTAENEATTALNAANAAQASADAADVTAERALNLALTLNNTALLKANNLSDLSNASSARINLGVQYYPATYAFDVVEDGLVRGVPLVHDYAMPANFLGTVCYGHVAPTNDSVFNVMAYRAGTTLPIGKITFVNHGSGYQFSQQPVFNLTAGDTLLVECPSPADATLAGAAITFPLLLKDTPTPAPTPTPTPVPTPTPTPSNVTITLNGVVETTQLGGLSVHVGAGSISVGISGVVATTAHGTLAAQITGSATGVQAFRIADLMERFGVNMFPTLAYPANSTGASGVYTTSAIVTGLGWLTAGQDGTPFGSGLQTLNRVWDLWSEQAGHADQDIALQSAQIAQGCTYGCSYMVVPMFGIGFNYAITMAENSHNGVAPFTGKAAGCIRFVEGDNEPNQDFFQTSAQCLTSQQLYPVSPVWSYSDVAVAGPSLVVGLAFPDGWITGYLGTDRAAMAAAQQIINVHFYPGFNPDLEDGSGRGSTFADVMIGEQAGYGTTQPCVITEWGPTFYNSEGHVQDPQYNTYYTPMYILSAFRQGFLGYCYFAMLDSYPALPRYPGSGLWQNDPTVDTPRGNAYVVRAMYALTGDLGSNKRTFAPGKLDYSVVGWQSSLAAGTSGSPAAIAGSANTGGQTMLFQNSSGRFFLYVWNSQDNPGGAATGVTINFASVLRSVVDYNLTNNPPNNMTPVQSHSGVNTITVALANEVHLLVIDF